MPEVISPGEMRRTVCIILDPEETRGTFARRTLDNSGHRVGSFGIFTIKLYPKTISGTFAKG